MQKKCPYLSHLISCLFSSATSILNYAHVALSLTEFMSNLNLTKPVWILALLYYIPISFFQEDIFLDFEVDSNAYVACHFPIDMLTFFVVFLFLISLVLCGISTLQIKKNYIHEFSIIIGGYTFNQHTMKIMNHFPVVHNIASNGSILTETL